MNTVLQKSIAVPFYRSHAGLLIFVFLVMFGTVESRYLVHYHETWILGMLTSKVFMISVFLIWTAYSLKILHYIFSLLKKPEYAFLNNVTLASNHTVFAKLLLTVVVCFLPVLAYSVFIYLICISRGDYSNLAVIFLIQLLLCCSNAFILLVFLKTQHKFSWTFLKFRIPNIGGRLGFYTSHFLQHEGVALFISKAFSIGLLYLVRETIEPGDDFRILGLTWVFVLLAHTFLVPKVKQFEDSYLNWTKGLPISTVKTCVMYFVFYVGLMLPEIIFSITMIGHWLEWVYLILFSGSLLLFIHAYLFKPVRDPDKFSVFLFWLFMMSFFVILSKLIVLLIALLLTMGCARIISRYYRYEPIVD